MPDRAPNRPVRKYAGAALLASVVVHAGLLLLVVRWADGQDGEQSPSRLDCELVVIVDDDPPGKGQHSGKDVTFSSDELSAPRERQAKILDEQPLAPPDHGDEPGPSVTGSLKEMVGATGHDDGNVGTGTANSGDGSADFFQLSATGRTVVYVLDRSMSMGVHDGLRQARAELLGSLSRLKPTVLFQVIAYNQIAEPLCIHNYGGMLTPNPDTLFEVARAVAELRPTGLTNHLQALHRGLELRPDVLFLATDADELTFEEVAEVSHYNGGRCSIHVIDFSNRPEDVGCPLRQLALQNRGTYRRVAVKEL